MFNNLFYSCFQRKYKIIKFALAIPEGAPITLAKEIIHAPSLVADKQLQPCQNNQKQ